MPGRWYEDKSPEEIEVLIELHRKMTPGERLARFFELMERHESEQRASVRSMHPDADEREVFLRVASLRLDRETMIKVYGWDPLLHP